MGNKYLLRHSDGFIYPGISSSKKNFKNGSIYTTFESPVLNDFSIMKYSAFHRKVKKNGWRHIRTEGSHYIYSKDGRTYPVPFHGAKEIGEGLRKTIIKEMDLK
jgi:mRNA interferase HicA